ncbi:hypothetical protein SH449x_004994 [Pirellulaceae bacterium SH449]
MSSNLGLFGWIREGVRQSVLLGVSDALESIGSPDSSEKLHPALLAIDANRSSALLESPDSIGVDSSGPGSASPKRATGGSTATRKRLGRSLKDIEPVSKPATSNP